MNRLFAALLIVTTALPAAAEERTYTRTERELEYLMNIWPGDYDNREQMMFDADMGKPDMDSGGHVRIHSHVRRVDLPAFGEHVLYVQEYKHDDPDDIFRQRIYGLRADEDEQAVRITLYFLKDGKALLGAHQDASKLEGVTPDDAVALEGCDVFVRRDGDWLSGAMKTKTCLFGEGDNRRYSDYQLRVRPGEYWFRDRIMSAATDEPVEQVADFTWHQLEAARQFVCMIDFPRKKGGRPVVTHHYIDIHDQGGRFDFEHPDGRTMVLTMRNTWSYGMQRETFVIAVQENDTDGETLVYAWAPSQADYIGVNPGYLRVQCDLKTPQNEAFQQGLRPDS